MIKNSHRSGFWSANDDHSVASGGSHFFESALNDPETKYMAARCRAKNETRGKFVRAVRLHLAASVGSPTRSLD